MSPRCGTCRAPIVAPDGFLNLAGELVCRSCHYAEQTKLQNERADASRRQVGVHDSFVFLKRVAVGGVLVLVGGAALVGSLRAGAVRPALWASVVFALGILVVATAVSAARQPKE